MDIVGKKIISHSRPTLGTEEEMAVLEVIRSGEIAQGRKVVEFEKLVANYIGKKLSLIHISEPTRPY